MMIEDDGNMGCPRFQARLWGNEDREGDCPVGCSTGNLEVDRLGSRFARIPESEVGNESRCGDQGFTPIDGPWVIT
jgi:hypothetical protein